MKTICLVDDDDMYKFIFRKGMELYGMSNPLLEFNDGSDAIAHFKTINTDLETPEVIFLDLNMFEMDGWSFLNAFDDVREKLPKKVDVYIVSNSIMKKDLDRAKETPNISGYLLKPISRSRLQAILE